MLIDDQINVAIAEACGWKPNPTKGWMNEDKTELYLCISPDGNSDWFPSYTTDLNAMHEAEQTLKGAWIIGEYIKHLSFVCENNPTYAGAYMATARQRAEAWLRTKGLWKEAKE